MKKLLLIFLLLFPILTFANIDEEGFILYKRPLLPGFSFNQTDTTTELIYRGEVIKSYKNEEFAIELLPHGPNKEPDCYNSLSRNIASERLKTAIGSDYMKDCFILRSDKIMNSFLLLYSPSIEGNRVSLYDIKNKKYYHWILNTVLSYRRHRSGALIFLTKNSQSQCDRSISYFYQGKITKVTDSCLMSKTKIPVKVHGFRITRDTLSISYSEVNLINNEYITSSIKKRIALSMPIIKKSSVNQTPLSSP